MSHNPFGTSPISPIESEGPQKTGRPEEASRAAMAAEMVEEKFNEWADLAAFNPLAMARRFETLETRTRKKDREDESKKTDQDKGVLEVQKVEEVSDEFHRKNQELDPRTLLLLRSRISAKDTKESVHKKLLDTYSDISLADDALDFLIETTDGVLKKTVREVKEEVNTLYSREIKAGRNMALQAREFSEKGLGSPTALRDIYRDITGNPRDALTLFEHLSSNFSFEKMKTVIAFVLHSLGADLKAKGPSIAPAELHRLLTEGRNMQAILGVFRFFATRMNLINAAFQRGGIKLPPNLSFEQLARAFMKYLQERYPSSEKVLQMAPFLGLTEEEIGKIIVFTQMRDAIRQVAPKLYRTPQHRQDVLMSYIEALEELEEELEEEEGEEKKEGGNK